MANCMGIRIVTADEEHLILQIPRLSNVYVQFVGILKQIFALEDCNLIIYFLGISLFLSWVYDRLIVFHLGPFFWGDAVVACFANFSGRTNAFAINHTRIGSDHNINGSESTLEQLFSTNNRHMKPYR
jgi:hypothetical protein